ncbi:MAG: class I SAM-dependent methyltransferase, partial [Actinomadura rubrobrunea]|nr:class I SAM-dependent methyltransferase [Actinomadura rubrobrunea]
AAVSPRCAGRRGGRGRWRARCRGRGAVRLWRRRRSPRPPATRRRARGRAGSLARGLHPDIAFHEGSITALPAADRQWTGLMSLYSIIHTPPELLPAVFTEFARVLRPGGRLLLAFHVGDQKVHLHEWFGHSVSLELDHPGGQVDADDRKTEVGDEPGDVAGAAGDHRRPDRPPWPLGCSVSPTRSRRPAPHPGRRGRAQCADVVSACTAGGIAERGHRCIDVGPAAPARQEASFSSSRPLVLVRHQLHRARGNGRRLGGAALHQVRKASTGTSII